MKRAPNQIKQMLLKSRILVVGVPILYCMLFLMSWHVHENGKKIDAIKQKTVQQEVTLLLRMGCTEEAMEHLRESALDPQPWRTLMIETCMQKNQVERVEKMLLKEPIRNRVLEWWRLLSYFMKKKQWAKAYSICSIVVDALPEEALADETRQTMERLLAHQEKEVLNGSVVSSWQGNPQRAILWDERGYFLVDEFGEEVVSGRRFPNLRYSGDHSFIVTVSMFRLEIDGMGRIKKWTKRPASGPSDAGRGVKNDEEEAPDAPIVSFGERGAMGYETANGSVVVEALYDELSPVSHRGIGFGKKDGKWYKISFPALSAYGGRSKNAMANGG